MSAPSSPAPAIRTLTGAATLFATALILPAPAHAQTDRVIGPVTSVSGNTFEVARPSGEATVAYNNATKIVEPVPAQIGEVTAGTCIKAGATPDSPPADTGTITAKWVAISTPVDGKCPQRPVGADISAPPFPHRGVRGVVTAVSGDTVTVNADGGGQTNVTIIDSTHLRRLAPISASSISTGKCVAARGSKDDSGVLQATRVTVWAPEEGNCPEPPL